MLNWPLLPSGITTRREGDLHKHEVPHPYDIVSGRAKGSYATACQKQALIITGGNLTPNPDCPPGMAKLVFYEHQADVTLAKKFSKTHRKQDGTSQPSLVPLSIVHGYNRFAIIQRRELYQAERDGVNSPGGFRALCELRYMVLLLEKIRDEVERACISGQMNSSWHSTYLNRWLFRHFFGISHYQSGREIFDRGIGAGWYDVTDAARSLGLHSTLPLSAI